MLCIFNKSIYFLLFQNLPIWCTPIKENLSLLFSNKMSLFQFHFKCHQVTGIFYQLRKYGFPLCIIKQYNMKTHKMEELKIQVFLTQTLDEGDCLHASPGNSKPWDRPPEILVGPQNRSQSFAESINSLPLPVIEQQYLGRPAFILDTAP